MSQDKTIEALAEQKLLEIAYTYGEHTALKHIDVSGPAATDDEGKSLLFTEPHPRDWQWFQDFGEENLYNGLGALTPEAAEEMFRDGYRDQMAEHLEADEEPASAANDPEVLGRFRRLYDGGSTRPVDWGVDDYGPWLLVDDGAASTWVQAQDVTAELVDMAEEIRDDDAQFDAGTSRSYHYICEELPRHHDDAVPADILDQARLARLRDRAQGEGDDQQYRLLCLATIGLRALVSENRKVSPEDVLQARAHARLFLMTPVFSGPYSEGSRPRRRRTRREALVDNDSPT